MSLNTVDLGAVTERGDRELAARAAHDFDAFAELYRRHLCSIYRFVRSQAPDDATAEDLTAQVFFKALSSAGTYRGSGSYRAWLFRIAHNSIATWGKHKTRSVIVLSEVPDSTDPAPSPASQAIATEERSFVRQKVAELPPAQREVVALRYLEDFSIEEVAAITRRKQGAVRILLHRARIGLRKTLEGKEAT